MFAVLAGGIAGELLGIEDRLQRLGDRLQARFARGDGRGSTISEGFFTATLLLDRKSTRLNSSHANISYAVFCLKKKKRSSYLTHVELIIWLVSAPLSPSLILP